MPDNKNSLIAAFGYWAGYASTAVALEFCAAQERGKICGDLEAYQNNEAWLNYIRDTLSGVKEAAITGLVIRALGRVGLREGHLCEVLDLKITEWDLNETAGRCEFQQIF